MRSQYETSYPANGPINGGATIPEYSKDQHNYSPENEYAYIADVPAPLGHHQQQELYHTSLTRGALDAGHSLARNEGNSSYGSTRNMGGHAPCSHVSMQHSRALTEPPKYFELQPQGTVPLESAPVKPMRSYHMSNGNVPSFSYEGGDGRTIIENPMALHGNHVNT